MEDRVGLDRAYARDDGVYVDGDTEYIAGTKSFGDAVDDLSIPLGMTNRTTRYRDASRTLVANPKIRRVVGHSLGGAVALQMQQDNPNLKSMTYGAPVFSFSGSSERRRSLGDPISMFDFGARETAPSTYNPHSYQDIGNRTEAPPEHETDPSQIGTITDGVYTSAHEAPEVPAHTPGAAPDGHTYAGVDYEIA